ncbi:PKD repeat protein [Parabacteroides sp. PFB2-12]|uniref:PKD domain-containing protein n=1 Tax=unclassified Parabacteroides TaxID=2649774 RepID=UPI0024764190|nr:MULTISPECIES: PKD domain-containing protein [unclassified Parabacteroides]MDH6341454.1 PKD repeat protein [Parabacteroides sp. PM6-13]MDH6389248.1 PKD repeat protein [Parabacteroides sp. PFB2-12]
MKKRLTLFTFLLFLLITGQFSAIAQISEGGLPPSFEHPSLSLRQATVPFTAKVDFDVNTLIREDLERETMGVPLRAAISIPENISLMQKGEWATLSNGQQILRYTIHAPGAIATLLTYEEFYIPEGGKLFIYNADQTQVLGAYTSRTNPSGGQFSTQLLSGDEFTLEYVSPYKANENIFVAVEHQPRINISGIGYGYNYMETYDTRPQLRAGESGKCMVDINCEEGDDWQVEKTGVAKSLTRIGGASGGWYLCSGTLINNTAQDLTPFFLTASHCFTDNKGVDVSAEDLLMAQYYFDYEYDTCGSLVVRSDVKTLIGSEMLVRIPIEGASDGALLKLETQPDWQVYFNGWDRTNTPMTSGVGIHHPQGDVKKISTVTTPAVDASWAGSDGSRGAENAHWNVYFSQTQNGYSVTEGGSSGSPLFNQDGLVVGTLSGGSSSCSAPNGRNLYGKLYYHWDQVNDLDLQMAAYLDKGATGATRLEGTYEGGGKATAFFKTNATEIYVFKSITYTNLSSRATSYEWSFPGGNITSSTEIGPHTVTYNTPGEYETTLTVNKGTENEAVYSLTIHVVEKGDNPVAPKASFAIENAVMQEGFDNVVYATDFPPAGWTVSLGDEAQSANQWVPGNPGSSTPTFNTINPDNVASAMVVYDEAAPVDAWLSTPLMNIPAKAKLEFYAGYSSFRLEGGVLNCYIVEAGKEPIKVWTNATDIGGSLAWNWYPQTVDLSAYANKEAQIAWQYYGQTGNLAGIDGVRMTEATQEKVTIYVGEYIQLTDLSTGPPILYDWTFDGGSPEASAEENPIVQYLNPGTYDITLRVKNYRGEDTYTLEDAITVKQRVPVGGFEAVVEGGYTLTSYGPFAPKEANVYFADKSENYPTEWDWQFYGGTPSASTAQNPGKVVYNQTGAYDFAYTATNGEGSDKIELEEFAKIGYTSGNIWNMSYGEETMEAHAFSGGYYTGTNTGNYGKMAERFEAPVEMGFIESVDLMILTGDLTGGNDLTVSIAREAKGLPGTIIQTKALPLSEINPNGYTTVVFDEAVALDEAFYIVVDGFRQNKATLAIAASEGREGEILKNTAYTEYYLGIFGMYLRIGWYPYTNSAVSGMGLSLNIAPKFTYTRFDLKGDLAVKRKNIDKTQSTVQVETTAPWTATADSWITIQNGEGIGNGSFTYTVEENTGKARKGLIKVALSGGTIAKYVLVEQAAVTPINLSAELLDTNGTFKLSWDTGIVETESAPAVNTEQATASPVVINSVETQPEYTAEELRIIEDLKSGKIDIKQLGISDDPEVIEALEAMIIKGGQNNKLEVAQIAVPGVKTKAKKKDNNTAREIPTTDLGYTDGVSTGNSIGTAAGGELEVAIRLTQEELLNYHDAKIKSVNLFLMSEPVDGITVNVRRGNTIIHSQKVNNPAVGEFIQVELNKEVRIYAAEDMYIGYAFKQKPATNDTPNYVPATDAGPAVQGKGDLIAFPGDPFESVGAMGLNYNWLITASVEDMPNDPTMYTIYLNGKYLASTKELSYTGQISKKDNAFKVAATNLYDLESLFTKEIHLEYRVHKINMPKVKGLTYDSDVHEALDGKDYTFRIIVANGYDISNMTITTNKGNVVEDNLDGTYTIKNITTNVNVSIKGVKTAPKTKSGLYDTGFSDKNAVWTTEGHIYIWYNGEQKTDKGDIRIYTFNGRSILITPLKEGETVCQVPAGSYIVLVDGESFKVIVK